MTTATPNAPPTNIDRLLPNLIAAKADGGRIAENILQFGRLLRAAGLPVGPDRSIRATEAVLAAGLESPTILYWTLHSVYVMRPEHHDVFDQAFFLFWKDPGFLQSMMAMMLPSVKAPPKSAEKPLSRRLREPLMPNSGNRPPALRPDELDLDASQSWSANEVLRHKDFELMSADEQRRAREAIRRMALAMAEIPTRRFEASSRGRRLDMKRILRDTGAKGTDHLALHTRDRRWRRPPLVVLCDISGSMDSYARMLLHFLYAVTNARDRVHCFLFGTRLTHITRTLKSRDPDSAIAKLSADVKDWSGGTRIGDSIATFNRDWGRRVLGQNAVVLLITDGLDRDNADGLGLAARRLRASCRRLIWLNPLLRYDAYAPLAAGARELRPHVSELRGCHNLASLEELARALGR